MAEQANTPQVNWNDKNMATTYANVCNVAFTQEEVVLLFGMNQNWQGGQDEITIKLAKRMIIEGIMSIQSGDNPRIVEHKLSVFLSPKVRPQSEEGSEAA